MKKVFLVVAILFMVPAWAGATITTQQKSILVGGADLSIGSRGDRVALLQEFLSNQTTVAGKIYPEGIVSGYFGPLTARALARFQSAHRVFPALGYFGPKTKLYILSLTGGGSAAPVQPSQSTTTTSTVLEKLSSLPLVPATDVLVSPSGIDSVEAYRARFLSLSQTASLGSLGDVELLKTASGTIETIPALLQGLKRAIEQNDGIAQAVLVKKLRLWGDFYQTVYGQLRLVSVSASMEGQHRNLLAWFSYNAIAVIAAASLSQTAQNIADTLANYQRVYAEYYPTYRIIFSRQSTSGRSAPSVWGGFWSRLSSFVLMARAQIGALLPFGGRIESIADVCTTGELIVVGETPPPSSGAFFLYWTVYAANPFLYNAVYPSNSILGDQFPSPGVCNKGTVTYSEGAGTISFFGTSLIPYSP
ncbi:MAG: peptidoglycan-binding domain-containing protein [Candidatus Paceibacterota bacterium]|jgi:peptidoglycan hydrolase-like protein with peptidoglycan-binding domain